MTRVLEGVKVLEAAGVGEELRASLRKSGAIA